MPKPTRKTKSVMAWGIKNPQGKLKADAFPAKWAAETYTIGDEVVVRVQIKEVVRK